MNAKGMGTFRKLPDGRIRHKKTVGRQLDTGNRKVLTVTGTSQAQCIKLMKAKEDEWNKERRAGEVDKGTILVDLLYKHLAYQQQHARLAPKSIDRRECTIRNQIKPHRIGRMQIQAITDKDLANLIDDLIREEKIAPESIKKVIDIINAAYEWAISQGTLDQNPIVPIKQGYIATLKTMKDEYDPGAVDVSVLSDADYEAFVATCSKRYNNGKFNPDGLYGKLLLYTGMRAGEMCALEWQDYDSVNHRLSICKSISMAERREGEGSNYIKMQGQVKNHTSRTIELNAEAIETLRDIKTMNVSSRYIAPTRRGTANTASNLWYRIERLYREAKVQEEIHGLHTLRKTFATRLYAECKDIKAVAAYIGDLESTTMKYYISARKTDTSGDRTVHYVPIPKKETEE